jgi:ribonuclease HI
MINIFTDGSSRGNPGPGGFAAIIIDGKKVLELGGGQKETTNNKMEMMAAIHALLYTPKVSEIILYTDSSYLINGITKWIKGWKKNGWITKTKEEVLNKDLWMKLDTLVSDRKIKWIHISGHIGISGNERCDEIATAFADGKSVKLFNGSLDKYAISNILEIKEGKVKSHENKSRSKMTAYSYISSVGGIIKIHHSWAECEKRVKGVRGTRYKKSLNKEDEAKIIEEFEAI